MEVVSPSTKLIDKREKKRLYERFGVREYWIFYPDDELVDRFFWKMIVLGGRTLSTGTK